MSEVIGYVVSAEGGGLLSIALKRLDVSRYDYVYFYVNERVDGKIQQLKVLGQIIDIKREPYRFTPESYIADVLESTPQDSLVEVIVGKVLVLGYKRGNTIVRPKSVPPVGTRVYLATDSDIRELVSVPPERGLHLGYLVTRPTIDVSIDVYGLRRHLAIIAATGSGKTWTSILLIEELLKKGATIVVIDPHGEYVPIKNSITRLGPEYADRVTVLKVSDYQFGEKKYRVDIADIDSESLATLARIPPNAAKVRYVLSLAHKLLVLLREATGEKKICTMRNLLKILKMIANGSATGLSRICQALKPPVNVSQITDQKIRRKLENVVNEIKQLCEEKRNRTVAMSAIIRLRKLARLGVYTYFSTSLSTILRPGHVTVINLAGVSDEVQDHVAHHVLSRILNARIRYVRGLRGPKYPYPVVVIVEEAHRFAPPRNRERKWSAETLARIACEGRKFGVYLVVITQRPSKIDPDILSQCNSQIVLRLINVKDIEAVVHSSEVIDAELSRLIPQLNVGEAIITGPIVPMPLIVKLRDRVLEYGGGDIDVIAEWRRSLESRRGRADELVMLVNKLLDTNISRLQAEQALLNISAVDSYTLEDGTLSGFVDGVYAEVRLSEGTWTCSKCSNLMLTPCEHVITLIARAYVDGKLRQDKV